ncbi:MAG: glutamine amidotransferase [Pirellulales bacterium]
MSPSSLVWGSPAWGWLALALAAVSAAALAWGYWRAPASSPLRLLAAALKAVAIGGLALCLVEPLFSGTRARPGANMFAVVADNSESMTIYDLAASDSRGQDLQKLLKLESSWHQRLGTDFDTRRFVFDSNLRAVDDFATLPLDGARSSLTATLNSLARRFRGLPLAGVLLLTDGNSTDALDVSWSDLPPVYPVVIGADDAPPDVSVTGVSVSQTNFESAPVTVRADIEGSGFSGQKIVAKLLDESGKEIESQTVRLPSGDESTSVRFQLRPDSDGVSFYHVHVAAEGMTKLQAAEATVANNERLVVVDRGGGPYRVLYVCGRPNWEFKFLRRALSEDDQLELVGIIRIAKREPKFTFRSRVGESTNPLFRGFEHPDEEAAERYDQPVLVRLGTKDENELRDGFPKTADELYQYDAVILDDVESQFFSQDQLMLIGNFVSRRGGGLLMLGGPDSLVAGHYARTPVGDLLPAYVERSALAPAGHEYRLTLTREGWLQPWVRVRNTEPEERARLAEMNTFSAVSKVGNIKPAATVLAEVVDNRGKKYPALVAQRFGNGRSAALTIADLWRWGLRRPRDKESDLEKSWRQTVRWLVADVPRRVEVAVEPQADSDAAAVAVRVRVRDAEYLPLDNAQVAIEVATPDGKRIALEAEPDENEPGAYVARHVPRQPGAYRAVVQVNAPDGSPIGERNAGWAAQPEVEEFTRLKPNRALLAEIAAKTGGEVVNSDELDRFVAGLPTRKAPITEPWIRPAWHHPLFYLAIIACLVGEWGLRRWKGLA